VIGIRRTAQSTDPAAVKSAQRTFQQLFAALKNMPEVEVAAGGFTGPYAPGTWSSGERLLDGREVEYGRNSVTDGYREVFNLNVIAGRWFSAEDDAAVWRPAVVNERLARHVFGDASRAVGQLIPVARSGRSGDTVPETRIVGVVGEFRKDGELATPENFLFNRMRLDGLAPPPLAGGTLPNLLWVRVVAGTPAGFEEPLVKRLQEVARDWSFSARSLAEVREVRLRDNATQFVIFGTVAGFLLLMVALGLTGIVWQSVTERTREFGLRRAKGATILNVRHQVLTELVILASLGLIAGVLVTAQIPFLPLPRWVLGGSPPGVFVTSIAVSVAVIYLLTLLCGWYPSRLATRIQPAEALHYE